MRVNANFSNDTIPRNGTTSSDLFLIEHSNGLYGGRLRVIGDTFTLFRSAHKLPFGQVELWLPQNSQVLRES